MGTAPGTVGTTVTAPEVISTINEQGHCFNGTAPGTVGTTVTAPEVTSTINEQGHCSNGTAPGTVVTTLTAPEMTSIIDEHTSEVINRCAKLPIGAQAEPISEVSNGPWVRPDPLPLVPEFVSPFALPDSISPLHLVEADLRTDERPPLVRIQISKVFRDKPQSFAVVSGSFCSIGVSQIDLLPPIDHSKLRERLSQPSI